MNLKQLLKEVRCTYLVASKLAHHQAGIMKFIPGTYEREKKEGSSGIIERIAIRQISAMGEIYSIQKILCKSYSPEEKIISQPKTDEWIAFYDLSSRRLLEIGGKKYVVFLPEKSSLIMDNTNYLKVPASKLVEF